MCINHLWHEFLWLYLYLFKDVWLIEVISKFMGKNQYSYFHGGRKGKEKQLAKTLVFRELVFPTWK